MLISCSMSFKDFFWNPFYNPLNRQLYPLFYRGETLNKLNLFNTEWKSNSKLSLHDDENIIIIDDMVFRLESHYIWVN
jgi:hypothetical protein